MNGGIRNTKSIIIWRSFVWTSYHYSLLHYEEQSCQYDHQVYMLLLVTLLPLTKLLHQATTRIGRLYGIIYLKSRGILRNGRRRVLPELPRLLIHLIERVSCTQRNGNKQHRSKRGGSKRGASRQIQTESTTEDKAP